MEYINALTSVIEVIALIGVIITIFQSNKANQESRLMRIASFRPVIKINHFIFKVNVLKKDGKEKMKYWIEKNRNDDGENKLMSNIGNGPALEMELEWKMSVNSIIEEIKEIASINGEEFSDIKDESKDARILIYSSGNNFEHNIILTNNFDSLIGGREFYEREPYIPSNQSVDISVPESILSLIGLYLYVVSREKNIKNGIFKDEMDIFSRIHSLEPIKLILRYKDVAGESYIQKVSISAMFGDTFTVEYFDDLEDIAELSFLVQGEIPEIN